MKVLWISGLCWNDGGHYRYPLTLPGAVSGSFFQQSIIEGMEECDKKLEITLLTDYCSNFKKIIPSFTWSHNGKSTDVSISVIQLPIVSLLSKAINLGKECKRLCKENNFDVVIAYMIHTPYMLVLSTVKKLQPRIKTILIVPDLAEFTDIGLKSRPFKRMLKSINNRLIWRLYDYVDAFVLFTASMRGKLPINNKPSIVIEGVYSPQGLDLSPAKKKNAIMYAGSIPFGFGLENLVEAFKSIDVPAMELWIFGEGPMHDYFVSASKQDSRIKFYGFMQREKLFKYEKEAKLLINTRSPEDEYTRYSFPSKTYEYLASRTPFLTTWLDGFPDEYREYLFVMRDNKPETIAAKIKKVLEMPEKDRQKICNEAFTFVKNKKNKFKQGQKVMNFIKVLLSESDR